MIMYENKYDAEPYVDERKYYSCIPHLHKEVEAGIIVEGETVVTAGKKSVAARAGDAFIIFPHQIHEYRDGQNVRGHLIIATADDLAPFTDVFSSGEPEEPVFRPKDTEFIISALKKAETHSDFSDRYAKAYISAAIAEMLKDIKICPYEEKPDLDAVKKILLYCDTHYMEDISLEILEKKLGYNRFYISHVFSANVNTGFSDYIKYLRISAAKRQIRHTNKSITEIASDSGYTSIRTFNRQFFAVTGMTPTQYSSNHHPFSE